MIKQKSATAANFSCLNKTSSDIRRPEGHRPRKEKALFGEGAPLIVFNLGLRPQVYATDLHQYLMTRI